MQRFSKAGKGIVATERKEKIRTVGDIVLISAGGKHWHHSAGDSESSHVFVIRVGSKVS